MGWWIENHFVRRTHFPYLQSLLADANNTQSGRRSESYHTISITCRGVAEVIRLTFLRRWHDNINTPVIKADLFTCNRANTIKDHQSLWRHFLDNWCNGFCIRKNTLYGRMCQNEFLLSQNPENRGSPVLVSTWVKVSNLYFLACKALMVHVGIIVWRLMVQHTFQPPPEAQQPQLVLWAGLRSRYMFPS